MNVTTVEIVVPASFIDLVAELRTFTVHGGTKSRSAVMSKLHDAEKFLEGSARGEVCLMDRGSKARLDCLELENAKLREREPADEVVAALKPGEGETLGAAARRVTSDLALYKRWHEQATKRVHELRTEIDALKEELRKVPIPLNDIPVSVWLTDIEAAAKDCKEQVDWSGPADDELHRFVGGIIRQHTRAIDREVLFQVIYTLEMNGPTGAGIRADRIADAVLAFLGQKAEPKSYKATLVRSEVRPVPAVEDDDDEGCPVDDPSCEGRSDQCHDACEAPTIVVLPKLGHERDADRFDEGWNHAIKTCRAALDRAGVAWKEAT
jgi:hypothetical protein